MKATNYFWNRLQRPDRSGITPKLCEEIVKRAEHVERQPDGRWRFWGYVSERGLYLRVVTLYDEETMHNPMWDENFTRRRRRERRETEER
jgi:hypothetical protein